MVSYYNSLSYPQKHHTPNLPYPSTAHQAWFPANYHHAHSAAAAAANQQFLNGMTGPSDHIPSHHLNHQQQQAAAAAAMYYNSHMFHSQGPPPPPPSHHHDLYGARDNFQNFSSSTTPTAASAFHYPPHHSHPNGIQSNGHYYAPTHFGGLTNGGGGSSSVGSPLDETSSSADILTEGIPSPPNTTGSGGSGINSPGVPNSSSSPHIITTNNRNTPIATSTPTNLGLTNNLHNNNNNNNNKNNNNNNNNKNNNNNNNNINGEIDCIDDDDDDLGDDDLDKYKKSDDREYYDWMKKPGYSSQPNPGKTRTKDKYRVVYTDYQRLELEKEYHTSRYITIRRKTELAQCLQLSERQVKIWFQNRRAKERKQTKKRDDPIVGGGNPNSINGIPSNTVADELASFLDIKPKIEQNDYTSPNTFHPQLCSMSMGPPPPPNMLNPFSVLPPPPPPHHSHQGHSHHLGISSNSGQNPSLVSQTHHGGTGSTTNPMQHAYSQMLQSMVEPIP